MSKQQIKKSQHIDTNTKKEDNTQSPATQIANIQNNFNFAQNIDLDKLAFLSSKNKELADKVMALYEKNLEHIEKCDDRILSLEEKEQRLRETEIPYQRKFVFRSLYAAWSISIISLGLAGFALYEHSTSVAIVAISIPIGVLAVNMLGIKNKNQK